MVFAYDLEKFGMSLYHGVDYGNGENCAVPRICWPDYHKHNVLGFFRDHHGETQEYNESATAVVSVAVDAEHVVHWCEWDPHEFIFQLKAEDVPGGSFWQEDGR